MNRSVLVALYTLAAVISGSAITAAPAMAEPKVGTCSGGDRYTRDHIWVADKSCPQLTAHPVSNEASLAVTAPQRTGATSLQGSVQPAASIKKPVCAVLLSNGSWGCLAR